MNEIEEIRVRAHANETNDTRPRAARSRAIGPPGRAWRRSSDEPERKIVAEVSSR